MSPLVHFLLLLMLLPGTMGLKGHLTAGEIIEQLVHAVRVTPVRNVVFM
jgi:adenine C2-methylase RlmN of 23S rRNA A2503 and tRNA A37